MANPNMWQKRIITALILTVAAAAPSAQQARPAESDIHARIRKEGMENSQIMRTLHHLTDVYGPRLTGSPNFKAAAEWTVKEMTGWGFVNGRLEPWDFGRPGWLNEKASGHIVSPVKDNLVFEVLAWTPSTRGTARGQAVQVTLPDQPTAAELAAHLAPLAAKVKGAVVLVGPHTKVAFQETPGAKRRTDESVLAGIARAQLPGGTPFGRGGGPAPQRREGVLTANEISAQVDTFLVASDALVRVNDAGREHGQIRAFQNRTYDTSKAVPTVVLR
ncbi:MAG: peptidase M28, partial [Acidobacteria bacterium]|nr:peptidase M28 [Acidobacteriota bacterium]